MAEPATYKRAPFVRGDTLSGWTVDVQVAGVPQLILSARLHLRAQYGRLVYDWPVTVDGSTVHMSEISPEVTRSFPVETLVFDLELTLQSGRVVTWLAGEQPILADRTY